MSELLESEILYRRLPAETIYELTEIALVSVVMDATKGGEVDRTLYMLSVLKMAASGVEARARGECGTGIVSAAELFGEVEVHVGIGSEPTVSDIASGDPDQGLATARQAFVDAYIAMS